MIFTSVLPADFADQIAYPVAPSPLNAGRRHFVIETRWKRISNTVCALRRYSAIKQA